MILGLGNHIYSIKGHLICTLTDYLLHFMKLEDWQETERNVGTYISHTAAQWHLVINQRSGHKLLYDCISRQMTWDPRKGHAAPWWWAAGGQQLVNPPPQWYQLGHGRRCYTVPGSKWHHQHQMAVLVILGFCLTFVIHPLLAATFRNAALSKTDFKKLAGILLKQHDVRITAGLTGCQVWWVRSDGAFIVSDWLMSCRKENTSLTFELRTLISVQHLWRCTNFIVPSLVRSLATLFITLTALLYTLYTASATSQAADMCK